MSAGSERRIKSLVLLAAGGLAITACTALVSTAGLSDGTSGTGTADGGADSAADADATTATSCRALHASNPAAGSGAVSLRGPDGGAVTAYCDMETAGGGWTLVTPSMIVEEKRAQDLQPSSAATVAVTRATDAQGGLTLTIRVITTNCGTNKAQHGDVHYFLVGELDGWTQIMATYTFFGGAPCWNLFGDKGLLDTNIVSLDLTQDAFDRAQNMARALDGSVAPFSGRTTYCDTGKDNFWASTYAPSTRTARVVQRRASLARPAGLAVASDCGPDAAWEIQEIFVR